MNEYLTDIIIITTSLTCLTLLFYLYPTTLIEKPITIVARNVHNIVKNDHYVPLAPTNVNNINVLKDLYDTDRRACELLDIVRSELIAIQNHPTATILKSLTRSEAWANFLAHTFNLPIPHALSTAARINPSEVKIIYKKSNYTYTDLLSNYLVENQVIICGSIGTLSIGLILTHILIKYVYKTTYSAVWSMIKAKIGIKLAWIKTYIKNFIIR